MWQAFRNPRVFILFFVGFSSGLPLSLTGATLQAWFTQAGVNIIAIGALTLIGLPYSLKFLWAPLVDRFVPPWLGRRRGWICLMQIALCMTLLIFAHLNPAVSPALMGALALLIAIFSASQDIAVDAYRTDILQPEERGMGSAIFIFAYRMAMLISGGLALIFADYWGWELTYEMMAFLMIGLVIATYLGPEPSSLVSAPKNLKDAVINPFKDLWARDGIVLIILFIIFYKLGVVLALSLMSTFLIRGLGFSLSDVGIAFKIFGLLATILGAFLGATFMQRLGLFRALLWFGVAQAVSNLLFMVLAIVGKNFSFMIMAIFIEQLCSGMTAAAFMAFLMTLCNQKYTATQYAVLSALFALAPALIGPFAGVMVKQMGWIQFFGWSFILSFPGIILLTLLSRKVEFHEQVIEY